MSKSKIIGGILVASLFLFILPFYIQKVFVNDPGQGIAFGSEEVTPTPVRHHTSGGRAAPQARVLPVPTDCVYPDSYSPSTGAPCPPGLTPGFSNNPNVQGGNGGGGGGSGSGQGLTAQQVLCSSLSSLFFRSEGPRVTALQELLWPSLSDFFKDTGLTHYTTKFLRLTMKKVEDYQFAHGRGRIGVVGPKMLGELCSS
ncbi:MAG: hypothetical protein PHS53_02700 [Candidatus Pacebacteria bacterium]|nr:hypothetical protein [Candidatus Paceibacterota bacterium]